MPSHTERAGCSEIAYTGRTVKEHQLDQPGLSLANMEGRMSDTHYAESRFDEIHNRIQSRLDEVHTDLKQLASDLREGRREGSLARRDRFEGIKRALRDLLQAADRADREWQ
jgi:hypothetical protein